MSEDLIRRSDAIETAYQLRHKPNDAEWTEWLKSFDAIPSADQKTGEWDICKDDDGVYGVCSICGCYVDFSIYGRPYKVCPNCGARMYKDGEDE